MARFGVVAVLIAALLLASVFFYYANHAVDTGQSTLVRREDIYSSQKSIEQSLRELNQSIQIELEYQKALTEKVAELSAKADVPPPVINTTKVIQEPPTVVKVPARAPTPAPVTSAS